jgi:hypothetical protein
MRATRVNAATGPRHGLPSFVRRSTAPRLSTARSPAKPRRSRRAYGVLRRLDMPLEALYGRLRLDPMQVLSGSFEASIMGVDVSVETSPADLQSRIIGSPNSAKMSGPGKPVIAARRSPSTVRTMMP